jgi:hypothetical protein
MKEIKVKIHLPKELTVNIPTLGKVELDDVLEIISKDGKKLINRVIADGVLRAFQDKHRKLIGKVIEEIMYEKEDEIKDLLKLKL